MTPEQLKQVEDLVNDAISRDLPIVCEEMDVETAKNSGAMGLFENKYDAKVKVYTMGDVSKEIWRRSACRAAPGNSGGSKSREESSSRGVRRIKAVLER